MKISAIIMASGLSERMGKNKLVLDLNGKKIYQYVYDLVDLIDFDEIILVSSYDELLKEAKNRGYISIYNDNNKVGKSSSIKLGVKAAKADNALMFFVADQPLLTGETVEKLIKAYENKQVITYPRTEKRRGAPVIFPPSYRQALLGLEYDEGGMLLVKGQDKNEVMIDDVRELWDIDTYTNLEEVRKTYE